MMQRTIMFNLSGTFLMVEIFNIYHSPDWDDHESRAGVQGPGQGQQRLHHQQGDEEPQQQALRRGAGRPHEEGECILFRPRSRSESFVSLFLNFSSTPTVTENWHLMNSKKCLTKLIWKLNKEKQKRKSPSGIPQRDWRQEKFYTIEQSVWILGMGVCGVCS